MSERSVTIVAEPTNVDDSTTADDYDTTRGPCGMATADSSTTKSTDDNDDDDEETGSPCRSTFISKKSGYGDVDENEILYRRYRSSISSGRNSGLGDLHMLTSYRPGESKVERMAKKIETRIQEKVHVTFHARRDFLKQARAIAVTKHYEKASRIRYRDILDWKEQVEKETEGNDAVGIVSRMLQWGGILCDKQCLAAILAKAKVVADKIELQPDDDFHYEDFNYHHTMLVSRWPWMRHELFFALAVVLTFYFLTPILFCVIMGDEGVCPQDAKVPGWISALYFASATMSTVGYGDLSVEKDEPWKVFIGVLYMIASILVALLAFSAAAESALSPVKSLLKRVSPVNYPEGPLKENEYLYQRIRKVRILMLCDVILQFSFLNVIGILISQAFVEFADVDADRQWNWMDSMYWAVQTTTTIGYGDYSMPEYMRPMQIFYLTLGSFFTGGALGRLSSMKEDIEKIRRYHAFERREVNKNMMHFLASTDDPSCVDMYEFTIASLMNLEKIDYADVAPIMDKFRSLARHGGHSGYIHVDSVPDETPIDMDDLTVVEGNEGA